MPITLGYNQETLNNQDGDNNPNSNMTVDFGVITGQVLAVTLASFTADWTGSAVILEWSTTIEINNLGFNIVRATVNDPAAAVQIAFVPANPQGAVSGASYQYVDSPPDDTQTYFYWLIDVEEAGGPGTNQGEWYGSIEVQQGSTSGLPTDKEIFLPLILK